MIVGTRATALCPHVIVWVLKDAIFFFELAPYPTDGFLRFLYKSAGTAIIALDTVYGSS